MRTTVTGRKVAVITGAGAGVGRAAADEFARHGYDVALLSRDEARLTRAAAQIEAGFGVRALALPTDVADASAVGAAASRVEETLGPIDVWVNVAMATAFAPVSALEPDEIERGTKVTYLGQVHGTMSALSRMRTRNRGTIVNVGSALGYRSVPLQSVYCGAKFAIRGFTDSLRSEIIHDGLKVHLTMVDLPAVNTPQFDWARNKMGKRARPVAPVFQPEVAARAIFFAATHRRREVWVGFSTVKAILANRVAPALIDRYLAKSGYTGQLTNEPLESGAAGNLFEPVQGDYAAHGRFDGEATQHSWEMFTDRHRTFFWVLAGAGALSLLCAVARRRS
ncbi:SDR family oxidoreductase [Paraburkholderia caledonica]|jgi:short-subunit dehydrogenase|uniref:SDR family oxidoreductase n=1 Tax=Paraburkholderia caledonica TaxID=134536 RepID=UPI000489C969|nr:SDR family oxidoreductase [Paraburkholderia caledonica]